MQYAIREAVRYSRKVLMVIPIAAGKLSQIAMARALQIAAPRKEWAKSLFEKQGARCNHVGS